METCSQCGGTGFEEYEEDGRLVRDACYHCGNTGVISAEELYRDRLHSVACAMAYAKALAYKEHRNSDPEGEGFAFCAAENMMTEYDYFTCLVWDYTSDFEDKLEKLSPEQQQAYIDKLVNGESIEPIWG